MSYRIDDDVPVPVKSKSPFGELNPGQSLLIDTGPDEVSLIRAALQYYKLRTPGAQFTTRKTPEGLRIWRLQ